MVEHGGNRWQAARLYGFRPQAMVDFSANLNPLGPPPGLTAYLAEFLSEIAYYPDPAYPELQETLQEHLQTTAPVVLANGAVEAIRLLPLVLRPRKVLVVEPAFGEYAAASLAAGAETEFLLLRPETAFALDPEEFKERVAGHDLCFLGNPNNPTGGVLLPREELIRIIAERPECLFIVDESFVDFLPSPRSAHSLAPSVTGLPNLCVVYSLTKFFALPGLRLGCAVTSRELARRLEECSPPWRINALAARAGVYVLRQKGYIAYTKEFVSREREALAASLSSLGIICYPASANFILASLVGVGITGSYLQARLAPQGILIRRCSSFTGLDDRFIRLAARLPWENRYLVRQLKYLLKHPEVDDGGPGTSNFG